MLKKHRVRSPASDLLYSEEEREILFLDTRVNLADHIHG